MKSILTSNLIPLIIELKEIGDNLVTNTEEIEKLFSNQEIDLNEILCIYTTTSCFAPRNYDDIISISEISKKYGIFHVVNNAYGIYCTKITDLFNQANKKGNIDIVVSSTDKNFMVPVGGSLIYSSNNLIIDSIKKNYPGRASLSPIMDLFITLLSMGKNKYKFLIKERKERFKTLKEKMNKIAEIYGERILETESGNKISMAFTLNKICANITDPKEITYIGSMFHSRQISGIKIIVKDNKITNFKDAKFSNYGSHCENYRYLPYCAFAAAIGITENEITEFARKFCDIINAFKNKNTINKQVSDKIKEKVDDKIKNINSKYKNDIVFSISKLSIEQVENLNL